MLTKASFAKGAALAALLVLPQPCFAAVVDSQSNGFSVAQAIHIAVQPAKVYAGLIQPALWWSSRHTFSQSAANLTLDPTAGGCWCEKLPNGGSVRHLTVYYADPGKALVLRGPLGPLQGLGVDGALTIELTRMADGGTRLSTTHNVGGYRKDGLAGLAAPVDGVLTEQFARLKSYLETGSPEAKEH